MITRLKLWICRTFHGKPRHPHHGKYECRKCLRTYPVPWEGTTKPQAISPAGRVQ